MLTNIRYILLTALRDWLFIGLLAGILLATGVSATLGGTAFIEEREMTLAFASGSARIILIVGLIVFVCFYVRSAFDTKEIDVVLSRPISRRSLILSYWLGFFVVSCLLVVAVAAIIGMIGVQNTMGYLGWTLSLILEGALVVSLALFSAFTMRSAVTAVLASMGFYVLSRMMELFVLTAESGMVRGHGYDVLAQLLSLISMVVPRLDLFTKSEWLIYGFDANQDWMVFIAQTLIYVPIVLLATMADFRRRQF